MLNNILFLHVQGLISQNQALQNVDEIKTLDNLEAPPEYTDAIKMPKPEANTASSSVSPNESMQTNSENGANSSLILDIDDQPIPSYEEAIKKL